MIQLRIDNIHLLPLDKLQEQFERAQHPYFYDEQIIKILKEEIRSLKSREGGVEVF